MREHTAPVPPPPTPDVPAPLVGHGDTDAARLAVLRQLERRPQVSQRELSAALGLSLGKTHFVLHALLDKGLVKMRNFQRNPHKLAYAYVLTPRGLTEKLRLTRRFLQRKEAEYQALEQTIAQLRGELAAQGSQAANETEPPRADRGTGAA